jgi:hypothetical protein
LAALCAAWLVSSHHEAKSAARSPLSLPGEARHWLETHPVESPTALGSLSGTVFASQGGPIGGARVCAAPLATDAFAAPPSTCVTTDDQGAYDFSDLLPQGYVVTAGAHGFAAAAAQGGRPIFLAADTLQEHVDVVLQEGGNEVSGMVLDALGGPIASARVRAMFSQSFDRRIEVSTDKDGRFSFSVAAGSITLVAQASGYADARAWLTAPNRDVRLTLTPAGRIRGHVVDAFKHEPVPNVAVVATAETGFLAQPETLTDLQGSFVIDDVEPGRYRLRAHGPHIRGQSFSAFDVAMGETTQNLTIEVLPAALLTGRVMVQGTDEPCRRGTVVLGLAHPLLTKASFSEEDERKAARGPAIVSLIEATGAVRLQGAPPGRYYTAVQCEGHDPVDGPFVLDVTDRDMPELLWHVEASLRFQLRVIDGSGRPAPFVTALLTYPRKDAGDIAPVTTLTTDANGRYESTLFRRAGLYTVQPANNYAADAVEFQVIAGQKESEATLVLKGSGTLEVSVRTGAGAAVDDVDLSAFSFDAPEDPWSRMRAVAMGDGRYQFSGLAAGVYQVCLRDNINQALLLSERGLRVNDGAVTRHTWTLDRNAAIEGRVVDDLHNPLSDAWISVAHETVDTSDPLRELKNIRRTISDSSGRFRFDGLIVGPGYRLDASHSTGSSTVVRGIAAGAEVELIVPRSAAVRGRARDTNGEPVERFSVELTPFNSATGEEVGASRSVLVDAPGGRFKLDDLTTGELAIHAMDDAGRTATSMASLEPGKARDGIELTFSAAEQTRD